MERYTDTLHTYCDAVRDICYHPSGNKIAAVAGHYLHIWNVQQLMLEYKQQYGDKLGSTPRKLAYSHNGNFIGILAKERCIVVDARTGEVVSTTNSASQYASIRFTGDDSHIIMAIGSKVALWNYQTHNMLTIRSHNESVTCLALSRDNHLLASGDARGQIYVTDLRNNTEVVNYMAKNAVVDLAFFHKLPLIASLDSNARNGFYNFSRKKYEMDMFSSSENSQLSIDVSPDDATFLVVGGDGRIYVHETATTKRTEQIQAHNKVINAVQFSPDGKRFASCGNDGLIRICPVQKATHIH